MSTTADGHQLPQDNVNLFQKQKKSYTLPDGGEFVGTGNYRDPCVCVSLPLMA